MPEWPSVVVPVGSVWLVPPGCMAVRLLLGASGRIPHATNSRELERSAASLNCSTRTFRASFVSSRQAGLHPQLFAYWLARSSC